MIALPFGPATEKSTVILSASRFRYKKLYRFFSGTTRYASLFTRNTTSSTSSLGKSILREDVLNIYCLFARSYGNPVKGWSLKLLMRLLPLYNAKVIAALFNLFFKYKTSYVESFTLRGI